MLNSPSGHLQSQLAEAESALARGDFAHCASLSETILQQDAVNLAAHLFRGVACSQLGQTERAINDLVFVLERQPDHLRAAFYLGQTLRKNQQFDRALGRLRPVLEDAGLRPHVLFEMARCFRGLNRFEEAVEHYQRLLGETPKHADAAANLAMLLEKMDRLEEARNWADRARIMAPGNPVVRLTSARVDRRQGNIEAAVEELTTLLQQTLSPVNRVIANNELAQCRHSQARYEEAFSLFETANDVQLANDPEAQVDDHASYGIELVRYLRQWLKDHPAQSWSPTPEDSRNAPVFLMGFPASGTRQLGEALNAHPWVEVIKEQELLLEVRRKWISIDHFHRLQDMNEEEIREARQLYRQATAASHNNPDARVVIDQLPLNTIYLQLIHRLFPEARIIFARRDPRAVCLDCFSQTYSLVGAMPYFLRMSSTVDYYDAVMGLATDALETLPLNGLEVSHEEMLQDPEDKIREVLDFLDLSWNDAVISRPENTSNPDLGSHWTNYQPQLQPFTGPLDPWIKRFGYAAP